MVLEPKYVCLVGIESARRLLNGILKGKPGSSEIVVDGQGADYSIVDVEMECLGYRHSISFGIKNHTSLAWQKASDSLIGGFSDLFPGLQEEHETDPISSAYTFSIKAEGLSIEGHCYSPVANESLSDIDSVVSMVGKASNIYPIERRDLGNGLIECYYGYYEVHPTLFPKNAMAILCASESFEGIEMKRIVNGLGISGFIVLKFRKK